jgi:hypothetical protein
VQVRNLNARHRAALSEAFNQGRAVMSASELYEWFSRAAQVFIDAEQWQFLAPKYEAMVRLLEAEPEPDRPNLARALETLARIQHALGEDSCLLLERALAIVTETKGGDSIGD